MLLAVHSSPRREGNLERMVVQTAEETGLEYELIRLSDLSIAARNGCVGCARTQRCVRHDDMTPLYPKLEATRGVIMGGVNYNGRVNAQAHLFLERLFRCIIRPRCSKICRLPWLRWAVRSPSVRRTT